MALQCPAIYLRVYLHCYFTFPAVERRLFAEGRPNRINHRPQACRIEKRHRAPGPMDGYDRQPVRGHPARQRVLPHHRAPRRVVRRRAGVYGLAF